MARAADSGLCLILLLLLKHMQDPRFSPFIFGNLSEKPRVPSHQMPTFFFFNKKLSKEECSVSEADVDALGDVGAYYQSLGPLRKVDCARRARENGYLILLLDQCGRYFQKSKTLWSRY